MANDPFGKPIPLKQTGLFGAPVPVASQEPFDLRTGEGALGYSQRQTKEQNRERTLQQMRSHGFPDYNRNLGAGAGQALEGYALATPAISLADAAVTGTVLPKLATLGRTALGGALGSAGGRYIGREAGGTFGPEGEEIGGTVGGIGGGLLGGAMGYKGLRLPSRFGEIGELLAPPDPLAEQKALGEFMNKGYKSALSQPEPELGSPENPGWVVNIPGRMPGSGLQRLGQSALTIRPEQRPFEPLIYESPEEAAAIDQRNANLQRQAKTAGLYHAARGSARTGGRLQTRIARKF